jgi:hypothetical protein
MIPALTPSPGGLASARTETASGTAVDARLFSLPRNLPDRFPDSFPEPLTGAVPDNQAE